MLPNNLKKPNPIEFDSRSGDVRLSQQNRLWHRIEYSRDNTPGHFDLSHTDFGRIEKVELEKLAEQIILGAGSLDLCDTKLDQLNFDNQEKVFSFIIKVIVESQKLTTLNLDYNNLGTRQDVPFQKFLQKIFESLPKSHLQNLRLCKNELIQMDFKLWRILFNNIENLKMLDLQFNHICVMSEAIIAEFKQDFKKFALEENDIKVWPSHYWDEVISAVKQIPNNVKINLNNNSLEPAALDKLDAIYEANSNERQVRSLNNP